MATNDDATNPVTNDASGPVQEPMRREVGKKKRLTRVGMFTLFGLVILIIGVFAISERDNIFSRTFSIFTRFKSVDGLKPGAGILMNGLKIGTVTEVKLMRDTASYVSVELAVQEKYRKFIHTTSTAIVSQQGFIGDKQIELEVDLPGGRLISDGDTIPSTSGPAIVSIINDARLTLNRVDKVTGSLDTTIQRLNRGNGTLGKLMTDDALYTNLNRILVSANTSIVGTSNNLNTITRTLQRSAIGVDSLVAGTRATLRRVDTRLDEVTADVDQVTASVRQFIADANNPRGTLGALLHDRSIYDSLESITGTVRQALKAAAFAGKEFGLTMRGLRGGILGKIFNGNNDERQALEEKERQLEAKAEELRKLEEQLNRKKRDTKE